MARQPRVTPPGVPLHIIQRGNNRQAMFHDDEDRGLFHAWFGSPVITDGQVMVTTPTGRPVVFWSRTFATWGWVILRRRGSARTGNCLSTRWMRILLVGFAKPRIAGTRSDARVLQVPWRQTPERGSGQVSAAAQGATKCYSDPKFPRRVSEGLSPKSCL